MRKIGVKAFPRDEKELFMKEDESMTFETNTGMIELYSTAMEDEGFDPLPQYTPHPDPPEGFLRLNYGRAPMHTFARTNNNPFLADVMDENTAWINPKVAAKYGLKPGQKIWLENQDGVMSEFPIKVRLTERIGFDSLYMIHGFGHSNKKLSRSYGKGISDTQLITNVMVDPIMGGTGMRLNFVKIVLENEKSKEVIS
jgi:thiosulfate reductase/polysulfide reductase chain A